MREYVYQGHDNLISLALTDDSSGVMAASDLSSVTKMALEFHDGTVVDSDTYATAFDWSAGGGLVDLMLGHVGLTLGCHQAAIIVIDPQHPNGIRWTPELELVVQEI